ncbi:DUF6414 family protein [Methanobrevibacter intestini]|uniref:DUF6414 family protein n=1 Tax=Methanobrevibacter intestini TaxID=2911853 RepID=UPI003CEF0447
MSNDKKNKSKVIKIIYFDEISATDYLIIKNGGILDEMNKELNENTKIKDLSLKGKLWAKLPFLIGTAKAEGNLSYGDSDTTIIQKTITSSLLSDFIEELNSDEIIEFNNYSVSAYPNSFAYFKMFTPFLKIFSDNLSDGTNLPINISSMDNVFEDGKGYYEMIAEDGEDKVVLRFNINSFRNNYTLSDLTKMDLTYYSIFVGETDEYLLDISNELNPNEGIPNNIEELKNKYNRKTKLKVYDVILAGIIHG